MTKNTKDVNTVALAMQRHEKMVTESAASAAARALGLRRAATAAEGELSRMGTKGASNYWAKFSGPRERSIEGRRRAMVRKRNRRARLAKLLGK